MPYVSKDRSEHHGILDEDNCEALCDCGFKSKQRFYPYQAITDLMNHFRKVGTLVENEGMSQGMGMKGIKGRQWAR